jgi:hypothetical protein
MKYLSNVQQTIILRLFVVWFGIMALIGWHFTDLLAFY